VNDRDALAREFEHYRAHLERVAYRMLGSQSEAEDAVQEAWLRLGRADAGAVANLGGWLTTVVGRVCLDMLRSRRLRREEPLDPDLPEPIVVLDDEPEQEVLLAESVGLALLVVLATLTPAERLAYVLHDMFAVDFDEIARILDRSPAAARQLASRARRRVRGTASGVEPDRERQRRLVTAFLAASRAGDFEALVAVLDPEVVLRVDRGRAGRGTRVRGAERVARTVLERGAPFAPYGRPALVNGSAGIVVVTPEGMVSVVGFAAEGGRIVAVDVVADPTKLGRVRAALAR
jgi:RNA polymerase sigma factor (sigma-70 family)